MKRVFLFAVLALSLAACSKDSITEDNAVLGSRGRGGGGVEDNQRVPPAAVLTAFTAQFGTVPVQEWKLRSDGNWRAHFINNGRAWEATYTPAGILVKSEPA
jgi:hypothetical protein